MLHVTHPMTPFFSYRLLDLKDSTRANSHATLQRVCTPLGLTPMGVYLPLTDNLKTLVNLRRMILKARSAAWWKSPRGVAERARRKAWWKSPVGVAELERWQVQHAPAHSAIQAASTVYVSMRHRLCLCRKACTNCVFHALTQGRSCLLPSA